MCSKLHSNKWCASPLQHAWVLHRWKGSRLTTSRGSWQSGDQEAWRTAQQTSQGARIMWSITQIQQLQHRCEIPFCIRGEDTPVSTWHERRCCWAILWADSGQRTEEQTVLISGRNNSFPSGILSLTLPVFFQKTNLKHYFVASLLCALCRCWHLAGYHSLKVQMSHKEIYLRQQCSNSNTLELKRTQGQAHWMLCPTARSGKIFLFLPGCINPACYRHCCAHVTRLQFLALLSSNDPSTLLSDQCTTFLRTHWNALHCSIQTRIQTRNGCEERQEPVCKTLRFSALKGGIPGSSHITLQYSFPSYHHGEFSEWSRFVPIPLPSPGLTFGKAFTSPGSLPLAIRRQQEASKALSWICFDKLHMESTPEIIH